MIRSRSIALACTLLVCVSFVSSASAQADTTPPLVRVTYSPEKPIQGQPITALIEVVAPLTSPDTVDVYPTLMMDSATTLTDLLHPSDNLWIAQLGPYDQIQEHVANLTVYVQDTNSAKSIQDQITATDVKIATILSKLGAPALDPNVRQQLLSELDQERTQRAQLVAALAGTSKSIGTQESHFSVGADTSCGNYPAITSLSPNYGPQAGGTTLTITGCGFGTGATVYIGGQPAPVASTPAPTATQITVTTPALTSAGATNVEVRVPTTASYKNSILRYGYYVVPSQVSLVPVAQISTPSASVALGNSLNVAGSALVDAGLPAAQYGWQLAQVPTGSAAIGVATGANYQFTPDVVGTYVVELTVTSGPYTSTPVYEVITAYQPASLVITPGSPLSFSTAAGTPQSIALTLQNMSNVDTIAIGTLNVTDSTNTVSNLFTFTDQDGIPLASPTSLTLTPMEAMTIHVVFTPPSGTPTSANTLYNLNMSGPVTGMDAGTTASSMLQFTATVTTR